MYCTLCGRRLPEGGGQCPYCAQTEDSGGLEAGKRSRMRTENSGPGKKRGFMAKRIILVAVLLLLAADVAGIIAVYHRSLAKEQYEEQCFLGERYLEELDYEAAIAAFEEAIRINPKREDAYLGMAEAYAGLGEYEEAEEIPVSYTHLTLPTIA